MENKAFYSANCEPDIRAKAILFIIFFLLACQTFAQTLPSPKGLTVETLRVPDEAVITDPTP